MIRYYNPQTSCIELVFIPLYHLVVTQPSFSNAPPPLIIRFDTLRGLIPTSILSTGPRRNGGTGRGLSRSRKREPRHDKEICIKAWFLFFFGVPETRETRETRRMPNCCFFGKPPPTSRTTWMLVHPPALLPDLGMGRRDGP